MRSGGPGDAAPQLPQTMLSRDSVKLLSLLGSDTSTPIRAAAAAVAGQSAAAAADAAAEPLRAPSVPVEDTYCVDFVFEGANAHVALAQAHMSLVLPSVGAPSAAGSTKRSQASLNDLATAQNQWSSGALRSRMREDGEMLVTGPLVWTDHTVRLLAPAAVGAAATAADGDGRASVSLAAVTMLYHRRAPIPSPMHTVRLMPEWRSGPLSAQVRAAARPTTEAALTPSCAAAPGGRPSTQDDAEFADPTASPLLRGCERVRPRLTRRVRGPGRAP